MAFLTLAGRTIEIDEDGSLAHADQWDEEVAVDLANREGVQLTADHWRVVRCVRQHFLDGNRPPTCRSVSARLGIPVRQLFGLFPHRPIHLAARIGGVPKPVGYIGGCGINWKSHWR